MYHLEGSLISISFWTDIGKLNRPAPEKGGISNVPLEVNPILSPTSIFLLCMPLIRHRAIWFSPRATGKSWRNTVVFCFFLSVFQSFSLLIKNCMCLAQSIFNELCSSWGWQYASLRPAEYPLARRECSMLLLLFSVELTQEESHCGTVSAVTAENIIKPLTAAPCTCPVRWRCQWAVMKP